MALRSILSARKDLRYRRMRRLGRYVATAFQRRRSPIFTTVSLKNGWESCEQGARLSAVEGAMLCIRRAVHAAQEGIVAAELSSCNNEDVLQAQGGFLATQQ